MKNVIYVGKTTGAVMKNQIFTQRPVELIAELEKTNPGIGAKFISVDEFAGNIVKEATVAATKKGDKDNA